MLKDSYWVDSRLHSGFQVLEWRLLMSALEISVAAQRDSLHTPTKTERNEAGAEASWVLYFFIQ